MAIYKSLLPKHAKIQESVSDNVMEMIKNSAEAIVNNLELQIDKNVEEILNSSPTADEDEIKETLTMKVLNDVKSTLGLEYR